MRLQEREFSCGPAAVVNSLRALGVRVAERSVRKLAGTNEDGSDEHELIGAIRGLGHAATPFETVDRQAAFAFVHSNVVAGRPVILCVENYGHWVTVGGVCGEKLLVFDPSNTVRNVAENGCHVFSRRELLRKWKHRGEGVYFAIAVGK